MSTYPAPESPPPPSFSAENYSFLNSVTDILSLMRQPAPPPTTTSQTHAEQVHRLIRSLKYRLEDGWQDILELDGVDKTEQELEIELEIEQKRLAEKKEGIRRALEGSSPAGHIQDLTPDTTMKVVRAENENLQATEPE
ncbi:hypothetical protein DFS34DRAFT_649092 [Phlyctochytrium arcticum]|nr:hypothetical protein DFS34DRAFT_649092 [Phlyctochytrium arcticum]